jgi:pilus assembly protein CpaB
MEGTMGRRTVLLVAALVVAALGTTMVFLYVHGVNDRAVANQHPVVVLVAKTLIEPGTTVTAADADAAFEHKTISRDDLLPKALNQLTPIRGLAATTMIYPGEQIIPAKFGDPGDASPLVIPAGKLAIGVRLDDPAQAAGFVDAGTSIAIFFTAPVAKGGAQDQTQLLLPKVLVLAIGSKTAVPLDATTTSGTESDPVSKTILTLALDQKDLQKIVYASAHGRLNLALLGKDFVPSQTVGPTTQSNLFD